MSNNFNMSFDPVMKQKFGEIVADYGLTIPQAFKLFANQVIKTGAIPLSFDWRVDGNLPNAKTVAAMRELDNGGGTLHASLNDFLAEYGYAKNQDK